MHKLFFISVLAFLLFAGCRKENPPVVPPDDTPDTTSHNFSWTTYSFGGNAGSSYFKDVTIINDSDIWAVGAIYTDSEMYNAVHWDGKTWELKKIPYTYQAKEFIHPINSVFALNKYEVWFAGNGVERWDGQAFSNIEGVNGVWGSFAMQKIWMNSINDIYIIGDGGSIAHYDGLLWTKMESGTTIDLRDVCGSPDGKRVWACGYSNDNSQSILLQCDGSTWSPLWIREGTKPVLPYQYDVNSIWSTSEYLFVAGDAGIYKSKIGDTAQIEQQPITPIRYSNAIRGNSAGNHIVVVYDDGIVWHYNNSTWKQIKTLSFDLILRAVSIKENSIVISGVDYSIGKAIIIIANQ